MTLAQANRLKVVETPEETRRVRIQVRDLCKVYKTAGREVRAVDKVSIHAREGEFVSLLGPSGSGKSTVLNMIATLLPRTSGEILVDQQPIDARRPSPKVGYVFQKDNLFPWRTVEENVGYALELAKVSADERRQRVAAALAQVGLTEFASFYPSALSGGMRQRVSLMRTLITEPEILLMDEPFGALDTHTKLEMHRILLDIWDRARQTVIFVTHDLGEALTLSDRIILLSARPGRVKEEFEVKFPRPRDAVTLRESADYSRLFTNVWRSLGEEFAKGNAE